MATRSFHNPDFQTALCGRGLDPVYFISPQYYRTSVGASLPYQQLHSDVYDELFARRRSLRISTLVRRFAVRTDTTDLRFRETIERALFSWHPVAYTWAYAATVDFLRRVPRIGDIANLIEGAARTTTHADVMRLEGIRAVLAPGLGNFGFWNEGLFSREAARLGIPVFATITNYDNLVNMGYRGFLPTRVGVWSKQMADDAVRLQSIPPSHIEITGPVQYDRYFRTPSIGRADFLRSKGLDPDCPTILYAGGVNITRYFEMFNLLMSPSTRRLSRRFNVVVRPYPHSKLLASPGWLVLQELLSRQEGIYISNSLEASSDRLMEAELSRDLEREGDADELHALLAHSDVLVNHFSTVSLEAAICDLPTVQVGYDEYTFGHRYNTSAEFQQRQTHNRRALRLAASRVAKSADELLRNIEQYAVDRGLDRTARREYALSECGYLDGRASERVAEMIRVGLA